MGYTVPPLFNVIAISFEFFVAIEVLIKWPDFHEIIKEVLVIHKLANIELVQIGGFRPNSAFADIRVLVNPRGEPSGSECVSQ